MELSVQAEEEGTAPLKNQWDVEGMRLSALFSAPKICAIQQLPSQLASCNRLEDAQQI